MHVPILKLGDVLIVTVQAALTDAELIDLRTELAERVGRHAVEGRRRRRVARSTCSTRSRAGR